MALSITGDKKLDRALEELRKSAANRAIQKGLNAGAKEGVKAVKGSVPSRFKNARKAIGWRPIKKSKNQGMPGAKVGAAVGKRKKKQQGPTAKAAKAANVYSKNRSSKGGVGIGLNNIHWLFAGTAIRNTKSGANRSAMPAQAPSVSSTVGASFAVRGSIKKQTWIALQKEVAKLNK